MITTEQLDSYMPEDRDKARKKSVRRQALKKIDRKWGPRLQQGKAMMAALRNKTP